MGLVVSPSYRHLLSDKNPKLLWFLSRGNARSQWVFQRRRFVALPASAPIQGRVGGHGHQYLRGRTFKQIMAVFSATLPFAHSKKLDTQENLLMFMMIKGTLGALAMGMETKLHAKEVVKKVLEADGTPRFLGRYPPSVQRRSTSLPRIDEWKPPHPHLLRCHPPMEVASPSTSERQVLAGSHYDRRNMWQTPHPLRSNPTRSHSPMRFDSCGRPKHTKTERKKCNEGGMEQKEPKEGRKQRQAFAVLFEEPEFRNLRPGLATDYANEAEGWLWRTKTIWAGGSDQIGSRTRPSPEHPSPGGDLVQSFPPVFNQPPLHSNSQSRFSAFNNPLMTNAPPPVLSRQPRFAFPSAPLAMSREASSASFNQSYPSNDMRMIMAPVAELDSSENNHGMGCLEDGLLPPNDRRKVELDKSPASETLSVISYNIVWLL